MSSIYEAIKQVAQEYDQNRAGTSLCFGTVRKTKPLEIELDNKLKLDEKYFVVAQHLTQYEIDCEINTDEISGFFAQHEGLQDVGVNQGNQIGKITLDNQLKAGDRVIIVRMDGGQQFAVIDRIGEVANGN